VIAAPGLVAILETGLLLAHATWLVAICFKAVQAGRGRSPVLVKQNGLPPMREGLQRKARRICMGKSEDLERKARFFCGLPQKNAPKRLEKKCYNYVFSLIIFRRFGKISL
jgi:hypothetical protein